MEIQKKSSENTIEKSQKCKRCDKYAVFKCAHPDCIQMVRQILCEICDKNCHNGLTTSDHKRERLNWLFFENFVPSIYSYFQIKWHFE